MKNHISPPLKQIPKKKERSGEVKKIAALLGITAGIYLGCWAIFHVVIHWSTKAPSPSQVLTYAKSNSTQDREDLHPRWQVQARTPLPIDAPPAIAQRLEKGRNDDYFPAKVEKPTTALSKGQATSAASQTELIEYPEIPPGETPPGVTLEGEIICDRCWDKSGLQHPQSECDKLDEFKRRLSKRLYLMDQCRLEAEGDNTLGRLNMGVEVDFLSRALGFWKDPVSEIRGAAEIIACLNNRVSGFPLKGLNPKHVRYQFSLSLRFSRQGPTRTILAYVSEEDNQGMESAPRERHKRHVEVLKDRVRVRKRPVDGEVLGMISSGNRVILLDHREGWCRVLTPRGNMGWMICWALDIQ